MSGKKSTHASEEKKKIVKDLAELIKTKKTILLASIKNLPASQFQEIGKKLRGKAIIKVPRKNLIFLSLDDSGIEIAKEVKNQIKESTAILFSDLDAFELAGELLENKNPAKARPGQEAPEDIKVEPGPTELVPGPAISELGAVGIPIEIKDGKINIKAEKVIVKKGEKISQSAADIMSKLDIKPFYVGFIPLSAVDVKEGKIYNEIKINKEETLESLKQSFSKSLAFAVEIRYLSKDTIGFILSEAEVNAKALDNLIESKNIFKEEKTEKSQEEIKDEDKPKENEIQTPENKSESSGMKTEEKSGGDK
jgi:ribosomal protein L10